MHSIILLLTFWDTTHHKLGSPKAEKSSFCIEAILQIFWKSRYFDLLLLNTQIEKKCMIVRVWCLPTSFSSFPFNWNQYRNIISICVYVLYFLMCFKAIFLFNEDTNFNHVHSLYLHLSISSPNSSSLSLNRKISTLARIFSMNRVSNIKYMLYAYAIYVCMWHIYTYTCSYSAHQTEFLNILSHMLMLGWWLENP